MVIIDTDLGYMSGQNLYYCSFCFCLYFSKHVSFQHTRRLDAYNEPMLHFHKSTYVCEFYFQYPHKDITFYLKNLL